MESRSDALSENVAQTRKQITQLSKDKAKLEEELSEVQITLSKAASQYAALKREYLSANEALSQAKVRTSLLFAFFPCTNFSFAGRGRTVEQGSGICEGSQSSAGCESQVT